MRKDKILLAEDDELLRDALKETFFRAGFDVIAVSNANEALEEISSQAFSLLVTDIQMPDMPGDQLMLQARSTQPDLPVILMTAYATVDQAINAIRAGANEYLVKPFEAEVLLSAVKKHVILNSTFPLSHVCEDPLSKKVFMLANRVASSNVTVLISGESGTGKEVLARYLHACSMRAQEKFLAINCAAIPENMLEAELFGYEKGAFTGAHQSYLGKFEQAQGGTLLLDEISEMDMSLQAKLLRVLQEKELQRLGGKRVVKLDVRVIATTNRNLHESVRRQEFREDLFYRLNVFPLSIPPLRMRSLDILPLAKSLLQKHAYDGIDLINNVTDFTDAAIRKLQNYSWPGNVREMENVIQRALIVCKQKRIDESDLYLEQADFSYSDCDVETKIDNDESLFREVKRHEHKRILLALEDCNGSRKSAAQKLGISQRTLRYKLSKMKQQGIQIPMTYRAA